MQQVRAAAFAVFLGLAAAPAVAAAHAITLPWHDAAVVRPHHVTVPAVRHHGSAALAVRLTGPYRGPDTATFALMPGGDCHDGTIEVDVAGAVLPDAPADARGFVGVACRLEAAGGSVAGEGVSLRRARWSAADQVRRNHATQYVAYPGYDCARRRREAPAPYEAYTDLVPDAWTQLRIDVLGAPAQLYVGAAAQPVRMVRDLKRGPPAHGTGGLWGGIGPDGHFRNLSMRPRSRSGRTLVIRHKRPTRTRRDDAHDGGCCTTSRIGAFSRVRSDGGWTKIPKVQG
jgi:hypothetical protein